MTLSAATGGRERGVAEIVNRCAGTQTDLRAVEAFMQIDRGHS
jgi:hypothetical protein